MTRSQRPLAIGIVLVVAALIAGPAIAAPPTPASSPSRASPRVALTFDDGWSQGNCRVIARTLRAHDARATFFLNSVYIGRDPAGWRNILSGFEIANHTRSHPDLTSCCNAKIRSQVRSAERRIETALGRSMVKVLRPPYGASDARVRQVIRALGYRTVLWDVSAADTSPSATVQRVIHNATQGHDGSIVLMHCGPDVTPQALDAIIGHYQSAGYRLVTVSQLLGMDG